ncbi:hypothetical protein SAV31267_003860 [Streptomyces avermitilis]|uniref:Uncharacterized protein n=1 Tax=Streptomyces avermitilis TaxID=33903 RepID=A0A4D4MFW3_STRAX|nr:hypothetical protein SAV31267_003860 [Streptomyces avermitilis]
MKTEEAADAPADGLCPLAGEELAEARGEVPAEGELLCRESPLSVPWAEHPASRVPAASSVTQLPRIPWALPVTQSPQHRSCHSTGRT